MTHLRKKSEKHRKTPHLSALSHHHLATENAVPLRIGVEMGQEWQAQREETKDLKPHRFGGGLGGRGLVHYSVLVLSLCVSGVKSLPNSSQDPVLNCFWFEIIQIWTSG